jgi:transposase
MNPSTGRNSAMDGSKKFVVRLSAEARQRLAEVTRNGAAPARKIVHARVLLMSDQHHESGRYHDHEIARALGLHINSVAHVRKLFVLRGEAPALERKRRLTPPTPRKLDGVAEAHLVQLCCSPAPRGRRRWTMGLLAKELVGRKVVVSIGRETVRKALKKTNCSPGRPSGSAFPNVTRPDSSRRWNGFSTPTPCPKTTASR